VTFNDPYGHTLSNKYAKKKNLKSESPGMRLESQNGRFLCEIEELTLLKKILSILDF
jgi:hypothetical protein